MRAMSMREFHAKALAARQGMSVGPRGKEILSVMDSGVALTDREVAILLGRSDMNAVRPRITELIRASLLVESGVKRCPVTKKAVRLVRKA